MDPNISVVMAMLNSVAGNNDAHDAPVVPEVDFAPFNLSHLRAFSGQSDQMRNPSGGRSQNACDALPA
jgi:hypothetical protein